MNTYLKSAKAARSGAGPAKAAHDPEWEELYPALLQYLTALRDGDDIPRQTATMVLFSEDGLFKLTLIDRATQMQLWASESTVAATLESLEANLHQPTPSWRKTRKGRL